jgi:2-oxoglutarate dehydrogenase E2 component (dihydrolipoamide succinyltransferase)
VRLAVTPDRARAEVDGTEAKIDHGAVEIIGTLGSTHHVRLSMPGTTREIEGDVAIAEDGPVPAHLDLPATARAASPRIAPAAAKPTPPPPQPAAAPPAAPAPAPPASKATSAPAPTQPSVGRDFN